MEQRYSPNSMMSESQMWFYAIRDRIIWGVLLGVLAMGLLIYFFAPPHFIDNILDVAWTQIVIEFRSLPILGVRQSDLRNAAAAHARVASQGGYWTFFFILSSIVSVAVFALSTTLLVRKGKLAKADKVVRGAEFISAKAHNKTMRKTFGKKPPMLMGAPLELGKERLVVPEALQYLHFAFCGASGCGKSTALEEIIEHGLRFGHKGFVIDLGGAFYSKFGRPCDHVLSLRDPRSRKWDFWSEEDVDPDNIAAALIEAESTGTKFFWTAARGVWAALIRNSRSIEDVFKNLMKPTQTLQKDLAKVGEISARVLGEGKGNQADGVLGTSALSMSFLKELNQWNQDQDSFSITDWMNDNHDDSWVYVLVNDRDLEVAKPLLRVWFELACLAVLQRDLANPNNLHTWLIVDELKTIGQLPSLPAILDKGRKYRASVALGFQAISQVKKIYGEDDSKSILQGIQNQFFFRMSEVESAQYVSDALGEQDVEQASVSASFGPHDHANRGSISRSVIRRKLVLPDEVRSLETLSAYTKLSGYKPVKVSFVPKNRPQRTHTAVSRTNEEKVREFSKLLAEANNSTKSAVEPEVKVDAGTNSKEKSATQINTPKEETKEETKQTDVQTKPQDLKNETSETSNGFIPGAAEESA